MSDRYAFATLVTSDSYLPGALALAAALKEVHPSPPVHPEVPFQIVCIVSPETVDVKTIKFLRKAFDVVIGVEVIEEELSEELKLLGRPDLHSVLTKLHVFRLVQFEKVIFLDADILPIKALSHLFTLPYEFSAVPDVGWPDIFNSGMMVLTPGNDKFNDIMSLVKTKGSWDGGDQGVLNEWRGSDWNRLSFTYNTTPTAAYTYAPAYERFGSQIKALHFIGTNKPWNEIPYRAPSSSAFVNQSTHQTSDPEMSSNMVTVATPQSYAYSSLVDRWFDVYDRNYRQQVPLPDKEYEARKYENIWDQPQTVQSQGRGASAPASTSGGALGLDDLRKLAIEGASSTVQQSGEGEYRSLPLEGRIDLMRPKKELPPPPEIRITSETSPAAQQLGGGNTNKEQTFWQESFISTGQSPMTTRPSQLPPSPHLTAISLPPSGPPTLRASAWNTPIGSSASQVSQPDQGAGALNIDTQQLASSPMVNSQAAKLGEGQNRSETSSTSYQPQNQSDEGYVRFSHMSEGASQINKRMTEGQSQSAQQQHTGQAQYRQYNEAQKEARGQPTTNVFSSQPAEPARPRSPPLVSWNPAVEPPPNIPPTPSAFPSEAYFPNAWDITPGSAKLHAAFTGSPPPVSSSFFEAPPPRQIPSRLIQEGHYQNVLGPSTEEKKVNPHQPDITKVSSIFPWEQKLRHVPGRVFPEGEVAPNAKYIEDNPPVPEPEPEPEPQPLVSVPEVKQGKETSQMRIQIPSPPIGYPGARGYSNAWDSVPSIQKYASRLAQSFLPPSQPPANISPRSRKRSDSYRSRGEQSDANSMDGDVEDEVDDNSDTDAGGRFSSSERSDGGKKKGRSRGGSVASSSSRAQREKSYRSYGVQTIPKETRSVAVQVSQPSSIPAGKYSAKQGSRRSSSSSSSAKMPLIDLPKMSTTQEMALGIEQSAVMTPIVSSANLQPFARGNVSRQHVAPSGMLSPRLHETYSFSTSSRNSPTGSPGTQTPASRRATQISRPPAIDTQRIAPLMPPANMRRTSSADTADSPVGPASPGDSPIAPPSRKPAGRVWNPSTGVDVFKRSSEEVLARFLRMGSWEDDSPTHHHR